MIKIKANIVDIPSREIFKGELSFEDGKIVSVERVEHNEQIYIIPGFIDAHLHIESSMLTPTSFSQLVIQHGTVALVTDPHEIANVLGVEGIEFMMEDSKNALVNCNFTIPSSVPATDFDCTGASISADDVALMAQSGRFVALSEVMNVYGVLSSDEQIIAKIQAAKSAGIVVDGHAPLLSGEKLREYAGAGISTDHECVNIEEALEKISNGMKILIREGSAAKNYDNLKGLIALSPENVMFCTDDSHPDEIISHGHIDKLVRRAVADGYDVFDVLRIACLNPIAHYGLSQGDLSVGSSADFIVVDNLQDFDTLQVFISGECRFSKGQEPKISKDYKVQTINNFNHEPIRIEQLSYPASGAVSVIGVIPDELITTLQSYTPTFETANLQSDLEQDLQKIVYINRYNNSKPQVAFTRGFKLKNGAFASSVAHDSHNILAVGTTDNELVKAINAVIESKGGLSVVHNGEIQCLPLPIAGIISDKKGEQVAQLYSQLSSEITAMGCELSSPFMTLSFLSLVVIPEVKIGEKGLFSYSKFSFI